MDDALKRPRNITGATTGYWAIVEFNHDMSVIGISDGFPKILGLSPDFLPENLNDVLLSLSEKGWLSFDEGLNGAIGHQSLVDQINDNIVLTSFLIAPDNVVMIATFIKDPESRRLKVSCVDSGVVLSVSERDAENITVKVLHALFEIYFDKPHLSSLLPQIQIGSRKFKSVRHFFAAKGEFVLSPGQKTSEGKLLSLNEELEELTDRCAEIALESEHNRSQLVRLVQTGTGRTVVVSANYFRLSRSGPGFVSGFFAPLSDIVSIRQVRKAFPNFTKKEAEAITALLQGYTIKEAASILDKSPVTVALQARSALNKTEHNTLEQFVIHTLLQHIHFN